MKDFPIGRAADDIPERDFRYFECLNRWEFSDHLGALKGIPLVRTLCLPSLLRDIHFEPKNNFNRREARFTYRTAYAMFNGISFRPMKLKHKIEYDSAVTVSDLGHEFRHAWWFLKGKKKLLPPVSVEEFVLLQHFIEADGRAFGFAILAQAAAFMGEDDKYIKNLLPVLTSDEVEECAGSFKRLCQIGEKPDLLKKAMRRQFDRWIALSPVALTYDREIAREILPMRKARSFELCVRALFGDAIFSKKGVIRPSFVQDLVEKVGVCGNRFNYLTETKGLPFTDPFYTRLCNYRLEREAAAIRPSFCAKSINAFKQVLCRRPGG